MAYFTFTQAISGLGCLCICPVGTVALCPIGRLNMLLVLPSSPDLVWAGSVRLLSWFGELGVTCLWATKVGRVV